MVSTETLELQVTSQERQVFAAAEEPVPAWLRRVGLIAPKEMTNVKRVMILCTLLIFSVRAYATDVWISGLDPVGRENREPGSSSDFMALFAQNAPWQQAAKKLKVFKLSTAFVFKGSDQDLRAIFAGLNARGIALGLEIGFLPGHRDTCGAGVEGFSAPGTGKAAAERIKRLGGTLEYAAMDEPLWYGHHAKGKNVCNWDIQTVARYSADGATQVRRVFPDAKVGDIEPIGEPGLDDLAEWLNAYRAVAGRDLDFLHADVQWRRDWQSGLREAQALAKHHSIPFGVIINSNQPDTVDAEWTAHAEQRLQAVRSDLGALPDQIIFQSWTVAPRRWLPDNQSGTLTNLVARFGN